MSVQEQTEYIYKLLNGYDEVKLGFSKLYILVNSFDYACFKNEELALLLSKIALSRKVDPLALNIVSQVGVVATVDTVRSAALWDEVILKNFNFLFYEVNTLEEFDKEKEYMQSLFSSKTEAEETGLSFILKSMTANQK